MRAVSIAVLLALVLTTGASLAQIAAGGSRADASMSGGSEPATGDAARGTGGAEGGAGGEATTEGGSAGSGGTGGAPGVGGASDGGAIAASAPPVEPPSLGAAKKEDAGRVLLSIAGLLVVLVLAYVAAHPRVRRMESALGLSSAITAGFPFVALGLIARHPRIGIVTDDALEALQPLLHFGLGWLGFLTGARFDVRAADTAPKNTGLVVAFQTTAPFAIVLVACGAMMLALGLPWDDATFLRDAIVLATAAAMTSPVAVRLIARPQAGEHPLVSASELDEIAGIVGLTLLAAYFRPRFLDATWEIPGTAWLFVTLGMGLTIGTVVYVVLRRPSTSAEFLAVALGSVAFAAGMATYLSLAALVVCFVAGVVVTNLPGEHRAPLRDTLQQLERPIYLVFLVLAGALWDVADWRGWALMGVFIVARIAGLLVAAIGLSRRIPDEMPRGELSLLVVAPLSVMSIAIVVSAQTLYSGLAVPWLLTAVLGSAVVMEILAQLWRRFVLHGIVVSADDQAVPAAAAAADPVAASISADSPDLPTDEEAPS
jgi:hypothetical protein